MTASFYLRLIEDRLEWLMTSGLRVLLIIAVVFLVLRVLNGLMKRLQVVLQGTLPGPAQIKRADTLTHVIRDVARTVLLAVAGLMMLSELGLDAKPLLAAAGIGGLAVGFGAQNLVRDMLTGFFILLENQIRVGDVVEIAGVSGLVEEVRLRTIRLRDLSGNVHVVPNGIVDKVKNLTMEYSYSLFDVGVAYREDADAVMTVLKEIAAELRTDPAYRNDILEPLEMLGVDQFTDSAVLIKCRIKTQPSQQWRVGREMNRRIKKVGPSTGGSRSRASRRRWSYEPAPLRDARRVAWCKHDWVI